MKKTKKITLQDVAAQAGVSVSTASRAFKGSKGISSPVHEKILSVAEELGYISASRPDIDITILSNMNMSEVGHVEFFNGIMNGIQNECSSLGIKPTASLITPGQKFSELPFLKEEKQACLVLSLQNNELIDVLVENNIPSFIVNGFDPLMRLSSVAPANGFGGRIAAEHLINLGHQRILQLTFTDRATICQRQAGFRQALEAAGLKQKDDWIVNVEAMRTDTGYTAMKEFLQKHKSAGITAVQCCNDSVALGAMAAAAEAGYRIPEDISFIGFDDISTAAMASPPLTTVRVEREEMGKWAVRRLMDQVENGEGMMMHTELGLTLTSRDSTTKVSQ